MFNNNMRRLVKERGFVGITRGNAATATGRIGTHAAHGQSVVPRAVVVGCVQTRKVSSQRRCSTDSSAQRRDPSPTRRPHPCLLTQNLAPIFHPTGTGHGLSAQRGLRGIYALDVGRIGVPEKLCGGCRRCPRSDDPPRSSSSSSSRLMPHTLPPFPHTLLNHREVVPCWLCVRCSPSKARQPNEVPSTPTRVAAEGP